MQELTPIQKLDTVLGILNSNSKRGAGLTLFEVEEFLPEITEIDELARVLYKLEKDNFVKIRDITIVPGTVKRYFMITFEGKLFWQQNGYDQQEKDSRTKRNRDTAFALSVGIGTALAGLYGLFEIIKLLSQSVFHCK